MNDKQIIEEFTRWIEAGRPEVWQWFPLVNRWELVNKFSWLAIANTIYIVDDRYAEIRKAYYNNKTIQFKSGGGWYDYNIKDNANLAFDDAISMYRIKQKGLNHD